MAESNSPSMDELIKARRTAAARLILSFLDKNSDLDLFAMNIRGDLTENERANLLFLILATFTADRGEELVRECFTGAGWPKPDLMDEELPNARFWASDANANELRAYAMACVEKMAPRRLEAFKKWVAKQ